MRGRQPGQDVVDVGGQQRITLLRHVGELRRRTRAARPATRTASRTAIARTHPYSASGSRSDRNEVKTATRAS
ncbi:hypothetical protein O1L60_03530 [Streptomyces diastatochromogenes]|nr:hypothetical protein [Streptomyces diastatochromogenes]